MNPLRHIVEPVGLLLTWQPKDEQATSRTRRVVGEVRLNNDGVAEFCYLKGTADFDCAKENGFQGYPAFTPNSDTPSTTGVLESFLRRLPPRKRDDFSEFLALHRLPFPFNNSDFALLGYTGARLPSDGFSLVPIFPENSAPCDFLLEVAGFRHAEGAAISNLAVGDEVSFAIDSTNPVEQDAIGVYHSGIRIGYVNRALKDTFSTWMKNRIVKAAIERLNGKPERPLVYVRIEVR